MSALICRRSGQSDHKSCIWWSELKSVVARSITCFNHHIYLHLSKNIHLKMFFFSLDRHSWAFYIPRYLMKTPQKWRTKKSTLHVKSRTRFGIFYSRVKLISAKQSQTFHLLLSTLVFHLLSNNTEINLTPSISLSQGNELVYLRKRAIKDKKGIPFIFEHENCQKTV